MATSDDVVRLFRPQLQRLAHEECWVVYLTSSNRIIERQRVSQGGVTGTVVDHRLIVKRALELLADREALAEMSRRLEALARPDAAERIVDEIVRAMA